MTSRCVPRTPAAHAQRMRADSLRKHRAQCGATGAGDKTFDCFGVGDVRGWGGHEGIICPRYLNQPNRRGLAHKFLRKLASPAQRQRHSSARVCVWVANRDRHSEQQAAGVALIPVHSRSRAHVPLAWPGGSSVSKRVLARAGRPGSSWPAKFVLATDGTGWVTRGRASKRGLAMTRQPVCGQGPSSAQGREGCLLVY